MSEDNLIFTIERLMRHHYGQRESGYRKVKDIMVFEDSPYLEGLENKTFEEAADKLKRQCDCLFIETESPEGNHDGKNAFYVLERKANKRKMVEIARSVVGAGCRDLYNYLTSKFEGYYVE